MKFYEEQCIAELELQNRLLEAAGVTDTYFGINFLGDSYETIVVQDGGKLRTWFYNWDEAQKFVMGLHPTANWEETGW